MSDRLVRVIHPKSKSDQPPQLFSTYLSHNNIVLLGDPGAGKSHLFNHFTLQENAEKFLARNFLNRPEELLKNKKQIYIDALDERRAGRGDSDTIDEIVRKLFEVKPEQIRISCRAADWLGDSDLIAFQDYFDTTGDSVVLHLLPLSEFECIKILTECAIESPQKFLEEAATRRLQGFLENPQSLIMLAEVVKAGSWPESLDELYGKSTDILLTETNSNHSSKEIGTYPLQSLKEAAGSIFANRLISDIDGISVKEVSTDEMCPSYKEVSLGTTKELRAVLNRRIFCIDPLTDVADYTHRTIAEYLAAKWLATQIHQGLPLSRLRALIGVDGRPASELRGLHAWLPNFLNEGAEVLIDSDPYGVLCYGDVASLSLSNRKYLLSALAKLSDSDPWFRQGSWTHDIVRGLSTPDMEAEFRKILSDKSSNFTLRSIVLDALSFGQPILGLNDVIEGIFLDAQASFHERSECINIWINFGDYGKKAISSAYKLLGDSSIELRLRAEVLRHVEEFDAPQNEVANLINLGLRCKENLTTGNYYWLDEFVTDNDISNVLDKIEVFNTKGDIANFNNSYDVVRVIDALLIRYLETEQKINPSDLIKWLKVRATIVKYHGTYSSDELMSALQSSEAILTQLIEASIPDVELSPNIFSFQYELNETVLGTISSKFLLNTVIKKLVDKNAQDNHLIYELCLFLTLQLGVDELDTFLLLFELGEDKPTYKKLRDGYCFNEIPDWRIENAERRKKAELETKTRKTTNIDQFQKDKIEILKGTHFEWLRWIGDAYFGHFNFSDKKITPYQRIAQELGAENVGIVIEGLVELVKTKEITKFEDILQMQADSKYFPWWYALIAGLKEYSDKSFSLKDYEPEYLKSALAIEYLRPTYHFIENTMHRNVYAWKTVLFNEMPQLIVDTYYSLAKISAKKRMPYLDGIDELLNNEILKPYAVNVSLSLLQEYVDLDVQVLRLLLADALKSNPIELLKLVNSRIGSSSDLVKVDNYDLYLAIGFCLSIESYKVRISSLKDESLKKTIWAIRDVSEYRRYAISNSSSFSIGQLEFLIRVTASEFPYAAHTSGVSSGAHNPWDASDFVQYLLNILSSTPTDESSEVLQRLRDELTFNSCLASYTDYIKHALASQNVRLVDSKFAQPTWQQTLATLANLAPANIADLNALVLFNLQDIQHVISNGNTDIYKRFWNEGSYGKISTPKVEDSCRDVLVDLLRDRLRLKGVSVEPEGHMAADKRADMVIMLPKLKLVVELKRDFHSEVWSAAQNQLDRLYTRDPDAFGYGIFLVFWYGDKRKNKIPVPPSFFNTPKTAQEMQSQLQSLIPIAKQHKLKVVVLDVSEPES